MRTMNLVCNVCRKTEIIEPTHYGEDTKIGWFRVAVHELRPPSEDPRTKRTQRAMKKLASHEGMPPEIAAVMADMAAPSDYEPMPEHVNRAADICPDCGKKVLASLLPHLTGDARRGGPMMAPPGY